MLCLLDRELLLLPMTWEREVLDHARPEFLGDRLRAIGAAAVDNDDLVAERQ